MGVRVVHEAISDPADEREAKVALLRAAYKAIALDLGWQLEDAKHLPWAWSELSELEREADRMEAGELRRWLRYLLKRLAFAKGQRGARGTRDSGRASAQEPSEAGSEATRERTRTDMAINLTVKDVQPVREGQHEAVIRKIEERQSKFPDSRHESYLAISFEIVNGNEAGRTLTKGYTPVVSSKSHLGQLWRRLKGQLPVGATLNIEELIGERVQIIISHDVGDDGEVHERIGEVFKPLTDEAKGSVS